MPLINDLSDSCNRNTFGATSAARFQDSVVVQAIAFIDAAVEDYQSLLAGIEPGIEAVILDSAKDGIEQITQVLQQYTHLSSVHIVSHGAPGCLYLGNSQLSLGTLDQYAAQLKIWANVLPSAPLLLYGCNVAAGDAGTEFLARLHQLTGAKIAASASRTGSTSLQGDWELEVSIGEVSVPLVFPVQVRERYPSVFATFTVTNTNNDGAGSLRQAISTANSEPTDDVITFDFGLSGQTITLTSGRLDITDDLTINGLGANNLTVSGNNSSRVFLVNNTIDTLNVAINGLTIADGSSSVLDPGAGILNIDENLELSKVIIRDNIGPPGAGIGNTGFLRISESIVRENSNDVTAGIGGAGGIRNFPDATLEIDRSTISGNVSRKNGGAIDNAGGILRITNSTISGNRINAAATGFGGAGILNRQDGSLSINNSTITDNEIVLNANSDRNTFIGGGIYTDSGTVSVANTIVALNTRLENGAVTPTDVFGSFNSSGYNFIGDNTDSNGFNVIVDKVGTRANPINPFLDILQDNGGSTPTRAPLPGIGAVINAGDPNFTPPPEFDQRGPGFPRVQVGRVDIGAVESSPLPIIGTPGNNDLLTGTIDADRINGFSGNDLIIGTFGNDTLTGGGDRDRFAIAASRDTDVITDFGGIGPGDNPSQATIDEVDTLLFFGNGLTDQLTAKNLLLTQNGDDLEIAFDRVIEVFSPKVILQNFDLEDLDNLETIGNILFDGDLEIQDSFDVIDTNQILSRVFNRNTVTFLNDLDNRTEGFDQSDDVINGQGGSDTLSGLSGDDLLRGGDGEDFAFGGDGNDSISGGNGIDNLEGNEGDDAILGDDGNDGLAGQEGDDFLLGGNGNDRLYGWLGNDTLRGDAGSDTLYGGSGNDQLTGGSEADTFNFGSDFVAGAAFSSLGLDNITDFQSGVDKIQLERSAFSALPATLSFATVADDILATTRSEIIVYSQDTRSIFYNANGTVAGFGDGGSFAKLTDNPLATDFDLLPA